MTASVVTVAPLSLPRRCWQACAQRLRAVLVLMPLLMLLVGSCKTAELPGAYGSNAAPDQFRLALFPDQVRVKDATLYKPARGYVLRAQTYVASAPETLEKLTAREVDYLYGAPAWARKDTVAGANVWQYRQEDCVVDFYFYGDTDGRPAVSYADVRQRHDATPLQGDAQSGCLKAVMQAG